jgi:replicative superfamily II helicase
LTKLKAIERIFNQPNRFQIVGMSATMSGLQNLKEWLKDTEIYECAIRPVPLSEYTLLAGTGILTEEPEKQFLA